MEKIIIDLIETYEDFLISEFNHYYELIFKYEFCDKVKRKFISCLGDFVRENLMGDIIVASGLSPIEQIFWVYCDQKSFLKKGFILQPQWEIYTNDEDEHPKYIIDFILRPGRELPLDNPRYEWFKNYELVKDIKLAIELDGHEFHEKTKEQVKKDKEKDRWLTLNGYTVIRFTGSEIYNSIETCIKQVHDILDNKIHDAMKFVKNIEVKV